MKGGVHTLKNENSTKKSSVKYYAAAIVGALAIAVTSWAIINQNAAVEDEQHFDLNNDAQNNGDEYALGDDGGMNLGSSIENNIDFSELYPEKDNEGIKASDAGNLIKPSVTLPPVKVEDENAAIASGDVPDDSAKPDEPSESADADGTKTDEDAYTSVTSQDVQTPSDTDKIIAASSGLSFSPEVGLMWPVKGNVILNYSADHVVYHATLSQFRTNPAIIIGCEVGTEVVAAASGVVTDITETPQTGITLTMTIGDDYSLVYGQLETPELAIGDYVEAGSVIGKVSKVSRFYTVEGDNLYFQVQRGDETVNPMLLIKDE